MLVTVCRNDNTNVMVCRETKEGSELQSIATARVRRQQGILTTGQANSMRFLNSDFTFNHVTPLPSTCVPSTPRIRNMSASSNDPSCEGQASSAPRGAYCGWVCGLGCPGGRGGGHRRHCLGSERSCRRLIPPWTCAGSASWGLPFNRVARVASVVLSATKLCLVRGQH